MALKIVFMGTPDFSVPALKAIVEAGHEVVAVYSQPPRPAGRGMAEKMTPVHAAAHGLGIPVFTPLSLKSIEAQATFAAHGADAAVVIAYGLLLPGPVLGAPRFGCYNLHASKLPRWRGAAPIQRAIMAGDAETAVIVMHMDEGLDTGPVCLSEAVAITPSMTASDLHDRLSEVGAVLTVAALAKLEAGTLSEVPQPAEGVTYAAKIDKREALIDFTKRAAEVRNHVHGLSPFPGAWFEVPAEAGKPAERLKVLRCEVAEGAGLPGEVLDDRLRIACGEGAIRILEAQRAGKRAMKAQELLRGFTLSKGVRVGAPAA